MSGGTLDDNDGDREIQMTRLFVCLGFKEWVGALPLEVLTGEFLLPETDLNGIREQVESVKEDVPTEFEYRETRNRTSWGADGGEVVRIVLFVASSAASGVIGNAMYDLLRRLGQRERLSSPNRRVRRPMSRKEAVERARWTLRFHYAVDADAVDRFPRQEDELEVIGEEQDRTTGSWVVHFRDMLGARYSVEFLLDDDLPSVRRILWSGDES
jgi:hypothetical protein